MHLTNLSHALHKPYATLHKPINNNFPLSLSIKCSLPGMDFARLSKHVSMHEYHYASNILYIHTYILCVCLCIDVCVCINIAYIYNNIMRMCRL